LSILAENDDFKTGAHPQMLWNNAAFFF